MTIVNFIRTCQECNNQQPDTDPKGNPSVAYDNRKCKKCHSPGSLDYGSNKRSEEDNDYN